MSASVGELIVDIVGDLTGLNSALSSAQNSIKKIGQDISKVGKSVSMAVTLPLAGIGVASVKSAADFEQGMSNVKAVSGATGEEMESMTKLALKMGADTKYSAGEAAGGIEELAKAGLTTTQILDGGLKGALSLAAAGGIELKDAAEIASTALNAFKKDNLSVGNAADILAGAANASATDVGELKYALSASGSVASSVGMSFKDTTTALAVFAQNGLKGSDAGTSLKTMLMNLQPQTDKQVALFEKLGLTAADGTSAFYDQNGKLKSLAEIAGTLKTSMTGMTDAQRLQAMETIFGSDAIRASNILFAEGAQGVNKMAEAMGKVGADQVAAEKMNNLNGSLEQLKGSLETAAITIGTAFLPILKQITDFLTDMTNRFMNLSPETQRWILIAAGIVAAIGPVLMIIGSMTSGLAVLTGIIGAISAPVLIVIGVIGLLVAAFVYLYNNNEDVRTKIQALWTELKTRLASIFESIKLIAISIWDGLKKFWVMWGDDLTKFFKVLWDGISSIFMGVVKVIQGIFQMFAGIFMGDWTLFWEGVKNFFSGLWDIVKNVFYLAWEGIKFILSTAWAAIKAVLWISYDWLVNVFGKVFNIVKQLMTDAWSGLGSVVGGIWDGVGSAIKNSINYISGLINKFINFVGSIKITIPAVNIPGVGVVGGGTIGFPQLPNIPMLATGTNYVPEDMLAMIHEGEAVVPKRYNEAGGSNKPISIYLDGRKIYEGIDSYLGSRLVGLGAT